MVDLCVYVDPFVSFSQQLVSEPRSREAVGAIAADEGKVRIDKFDGKDFGFYNMQIEAVLIQSSCMSHFLGLCRQESSKKIRIF